MTSKNIELLMPAGDFEKLKYALEYGADAVYIGGKNFSLRARANNFNFDEMREATEYTHKLGKKIYVTVNAFIRDNETIELEKYLIFLDEIKVDAIIVSDSGLFYLIKQIFKHKKAHSFEIHLSTQANTTNTLACKFWQEQGVSRIVLARELALTEISAITKNINNLKFEMFVHGAMCISYSGRCFLSAYMANRDANTGDCAQPCRWKYAILEEDQRKGEPMYYEEDEKGAYIFNTNDMCLIQRIPELIESGVTSFKIEGRMKTLYYVTCVARAYRKAIDFYQKSAELYDSEKEKLLLEIGLLNNRGYTEGFYFGLPDKKDYNYQTRTDKVTHYFLAQVLEKISDKKIKVLVKNSFKVGDKIEILTASEYKENHTTIKSIYSLKDEIYIEKAYCKLEVILELENALNINEFSIVRSVNN
jgi:putative protease